MPESPSAEYHNAAYNIFKKAGFQCRALGNKRFLLETSSTKIVIFIRGKHLPYFSQKNIPCFPWETWIQSSLIKQIEQMANMHDAIPYIGFCYKILSERYVPFFKTTYSEYGNIFGMKVINTKDFFDKMKARAGKSWNVVDLNRDEVANLSDPLDLKKIQKQHNND